MQFTSRVKHAWERAASVLRLLERSSRTAPIERDKTASSADIHAYIYIYRGCSHAFDPLYRRSHVGIPFVSHVSQESLLSLARTNPPRRKPSGSPHSTRAFQYFLDNLHDGAVIRFRTAGPRKPSASLPFVSGWHEGDAVSATPEHPF